MKFRKKHLWFIIPAVVIIAGMALAVAGKKKTDGPKTVKVEKKNIIDKALAVGSLEPVNEIAVKSKISGVVGKLFVEVGDFVEKGEPLLEVKPDPTPIELAEAKRHVEMVNITLNTLKRELVRNEELKKKGLISDYDYEVLRRQYDEADLNRKIAEERLQLIEKGKIKIENTSIESVILSPITGFILEKTVNLGDPVVPLTSYQAGTELIKMADMKQLIFKGTVDEIDVGKIKEGMDTELQVGALPGKTVKGRVKLISLKARKQENTTVFPVEVLIDDAQGAILRAGFSANANIIIAKKDSVLSIPERVITFRNDSAFVRIPEGEKNSKEVYVETGLSDAIQIEIKSGLDDGQEVLEKETKEIT
ncbi:efflux RND transporter periplasmic adaptor subunit [bacterium]|nr:efflux RND transporter periplasmic adaptor subunit [bacterium]